jgi:hypothetical protein
MLLMPISIVELSGWYTTRSLNHDEQELLLLMQGPVQEGGMSEHLLAVIHLLM